MEEKRPLRRQPDDHHFWSLINARSDGWRLPAGRLGGHQSAVCLSPRVSDPLKSDWQRHVLACSGYLELGMFDSAAQVLGEIEPDDESATEPLDRLAPSL